MLKVDAHILHLKNVFILTYAFVSEPTETESLVTTGQCPRNDKHNIL